MTKPNFFILGAPKCGTTSLANWLGQHPNVFFSPVKEPHFFNTDGLQAIKTEMEYEALFAEAGPDHKAVGEGSTHYLFSRVAVRNILQYTSEARFVVCLRNPVDMAPALHSERLSWGRESEPDFEKAWRLQSKRAQGFNIPRTVATDPERLQYGEYCKLGKQLERLYAEVSANKVHCVMLDDLRDRAEHEYNRILDFLGLTHCEGIELQPANSAKHTRSPLLAQATRSLITLKRKWGIKYSFGIGKKLRRINVKSKRRDPLGQDFKQELIEYFEQDVRKLESLLARDLSTWLK